MIRMRRSNSNTNKKVTDINITPFTDVCLVLLIIFLLTATDLSSRPDQGLDIALPTTDNTVSMPSAPLVIEIDRAANFYINQELTSFQDLRSDLLAIFESQPNVLPEDRMVVIKADKNLPYDYVAQTIGIAGSIGVANIYLGTDDETTEIGL